MIVVMFPKINFEKILKTALSHGGEFAELFFENRLETEIGLCNQEIETPVWGQEIGVGLRVIHNFHTFFGHIPVWHQGHLLDLAQALSQSVQRNSKKSSQFKVASCSSNLNERNLPNSKARFLSLSQKIDLAKQCHAGAVQNAKHAKQINVHYHDFSRNVLLVNSQGLYQPFEHSEATLSISIVAEKNGLVQSAENTFGKTWNRENFSLDDFIKERDPQKMGQKTGHQVEINLSARPAPRGKMTVLLSSHAGGTMVHETIGHGIEADLAEGEQTIYSGCLEKKIAHEKINIFDDPTLPNLYGSYAYDDEGTRAKRNQLVCNGVLQIYLRDRLRGMKEGTESTGNGRRASYQSLPMVRMSNFFIAPGSEDPKDLLRAVSDGIYVEQMGGGEVDTVTGSFVFEITGGYLIRNGKKDEPIRGATLAGNASEVMNQPLRLGNDLGFAMGTCEKDGQDASVADAQPTLLIPEITIGAMG